MKIGLFKFGSENEEIGLHRTPFLSLLWKVQKDLHYFPIHFLNSLDFSRLTMASLSNVGLSVSASLLL